jgi:hypothetical protein
MAIRFRKPLELSRNLYERFRVGIAVERNEYAGRDGASYDARRNLRSGQEFQQRSEGFEAFEVLPVHQMGNRPFLRATILHRMSPGYCFGSGAISSRASSSTTNTTRSCADSELLAFSLIPWCEPGRFEPACSRGIDLGRFIVELTADLAGQHLRKIRWAAGCVCGGDFAPGL